MTATKTGTDRKTNGTPRPEGIRVPLAQRIRPFNLAATESCRWFDGPWTTKDKFPCEIQDAHTFRVADVGYLSDRQKDPMDQRVTKHLRLILAAPLLIAAVEQYRLHCDAPLALTMAVDALLESIE